MAGLAAAMDLSGSLTSWTGRIAALRFRGLQDGNAKVEEPWPEG
jgi:hypothetical protein